jgi:D-glycero-D-manno-heptose 1,7-bisphosphate phosphatase
MNKAVFLDRDGVIVVPESRNGRGYAPRRLQDYRFYHDAHSSLCRLKEAGFLLVVVTNQPDVGNGLISRAVIDEMHARLVRELSVDAIRSCLHSQTENCACRKPAPGLLLEAIREFDLSVRHCFMVGDRATDIQAGKSAGCRAIFIERGYSEPKPQDADFTVASMADAAEAVLRQNQLEGVQ